MRCCSLLQVRHADYISENFRSFLIETGPTSSSFPNVCYEQREKPQTSVIEINCLEPVETQNIRVRQITENVPLRICELEIYGGMTISLLWNTIQTWKASFDSIIMYCIIYFDFILSFKNIMNYAKETNFKKTSY